MSQKNRAHMFLSCSAGAFPAAMLEGAALVEFEKVIGAPLSKIFQGAFVSSVASTLVTPMLIRDPANPDQALFSAEKSLQTFMQEYPVWTSDSINPGMQLINSFGVRLPFTKKKAFHYNDEKIQDSIHRQIGDTPLSDVMISFFLSAHHLTSARARDAALLYHKTIDENGVEHYNPSSDIKLKELILGTTAVPGLFKTAKIGEDYVCDFGHMDDADRALIRFQKTRPRDAEIHFVGIGPPRYHGHMQPNLLDRIGIVRQSLHLARSTSLHSYSSTLGLCEDLLGMDHVHDLSPDVDVSKQYNPNAYRSILDTSPAHISSLAEMAHANTMTDEFKRVCDLLGENYQAWQAPRPEIPPAMINLGRKKPQTGWWSDMWSSIFSKPSGEAAAAAPTVH